MKKIIWIAALVIIVAIVLVVVSARRNGRTTLKESLVSEYPALVSDSWKKSPLEGLGTWNIATSSGGGVVSGEGDLYTCDSKKAVVKLYYSYSAPAGYVGGWGSTRVVDCGDRYFVAVSNDSPDRLYGPFKFK